MVRSDPATSILIIDRRFLQVAPSSKGKKNPCDAILGSHPGAPSIFAECLIATDGLTNHGAPHRNLDEVVGKRKTLIETARNMLITHHMSDEAIKREKKRIEAIAKLGFKEQATKLKRFPVSDTTQKGNFAEIILAEYLVASAKTTLPVYRLRYNPNVDQSMKGDDVLAFDLDGTPVRLIVGEAKFRKTSSVQVVEEIIANLTKSKLNGLPTSLTFVLDRLYESEHSALAEKVENCIMLFAKGKLKLSYVGFLMSDGEAPRRVSENATKTIDSFAIISFGLESPEKLVEQCFKDLEDSIL